MIMKWEDLEIGDVIKFSNIVCEVYKHSAPYFVKEWCNKELIIHNISIKVKYIAIDVRNERNEFNSFYITHSGRADGGFVLIENAPLFELVRLGDKC